MNFIKAFTILTLLFFHLNLDAKQDTDILKSLDYPELQVVPKASERLEIEAKAEASNWWYAHWPFQLSALSTIGAGVYSSGQKKEGLTADQEDKAKNASMAAIALGSAWLLETLYVGYMRPYKTGLRDIKKYSKGKGKGKRKLLLKERLAEEALEKPARLLNISKYFSVITNLAVSIYLATYLNDRGKTAAGLAAYVSFAPLVFKDRYVENYDKHIEYKKKIYAPVSYIQMRMDTAKNELYPQYSLAWTF